MTRLFAILLALAASIGAFAQAPVPTVVTQVVAGVQHSCALTTTGIVYCWGRNTEGQLGDGSTTNRDTPTLVPGLSDVVAIAAYGEEPTDGITHHTCALTSAGAVKCWGSNSDGQLGIGSVGGGPFTSPQNVSGLSSGVAAIAVGSRHSCALTTAGAVKCWGDNDKGQLGRNNRADQSSPADVFTSSSDATPLTGVKAISAGYRNSCALLNDGTVKCWGFNNFGQVGNGTLADNDGGSAAILAPKTVAGLGGAASAIAVGGYHVCAIVAGGVKCWGRNETVQLGHTSAGSPAQSLTPVDASGLSSGVAKLTAGIRHTCAVTTSGAAKCWGENDHGQAGFGNTISIRPLPSDTFAGEVIGLASGVLEISGGYQHSCALTVDGSVRCWGGNADGRIGHAVTGGDVVFPVTPTGLRSAIPSAQVAAGGQHTCARTSAGGAMCWGRNVEGQLGNGAALAGPASVTIPVAVTGLSGVLSIVSGANHSCALVTGDAVKCWGAGGLGQLGNGAAADSSTPVDVTGLGSGVSAIAAGDNHTCALLSGGTVKCWGSNSNGQIGNNVNGGGQENTPVDVHTSSSVATALPNVTAIAMGRFHSCALGTFGAKCWGYNEDGQLGTQAKTTGGNLGISTPSTVTAEGGTIDAISGGHHHTCAKVGTGVKCWGSNASGQLGNNTLTEAVTASVQVLDSVLPTVTLSGVASIEMGANHSCAALTGGAVKCWGLNANGQLGDSTTTNSSLTRLARGFGDAGLLSLSAGTDHTCGVNAAGVTRCWGANGEGRLGDTTTTQRSSPTDALLGSQTLTFASLAALKYVTPAGLSATALSGLAAEFDSWTPSTCTVSGTTVTPTELGLCGLRARQTGSADFRHAPQQLRLLVVGKADQNLAITTIPDQTLNDAPVTITLSAGPGGSGNPVTFSSLTGTVCSVSGTTMTTLASGTCTVAADQAGNTHYNAGHAETSFQIFKDDQTIAFGTAPTPVYAPGGQFSVSATATPSGLAVSYEVPTTTSVCVTANTAPTTNPAINILAAGTCTVRATQAGDANYNAATPVTQDVTIAKANQTITFTSATSKTFGDAPFALSAANTGHNSGNAITLSDNTPSVCTYSAGQVTILAAGTCRIDAHQDGNGNYNEANAQRTITIAQAAQAISGFTNPGPKTFGDAPFSVSGGVTGGGSGEPVQFFSTTPGVCTATLAGTVTITHAGDCTIEARQAGNSNYLAAPNVPQTFTIGKQAQAINGFTNPGPRTFQDPDFSVAAGVTGGGSGLPVQFFSTTTGVCTVTLGGTVSIVHAGSCTIEARQAGNGDYLAAPNVPHTFAVNRKAQTISGFAAIADKLRIDPPFGVSATASSGLAVAFTRRAASASVCTISGTTVTIVGTGSCVIDADQAGDGDWQAAPQVTQSFTVNASVPARPVITAATPGNQRASVAFTIATDGGQAITNYSVSCSPSGNATGSASPIAVTGLTNGTTYSCTVTANNGVGASQASLPVNVVPSAGPFAYLADSSAGVVRILDVQTDTLTGSVPVGTNPAAVIVRPNAAQAYVANFGSASVSVIDIATHAVTSTIPVGAGPTALAIAPNGTRLYVANRTAGTVSVIDTATNLVVATVTVGTSPSGIAITPDGARVLVANTGSNNITTITTSNNTAGNTPVSVSPQALAVIPGGGKVFVTATTASAIVLDGTTLAQQGVITLASPAETIAVKQTGARAYLGHNAGALLTVLNTSGNSVVTTVAMGGNVMGVSVGTDDAEVYVAVANTGQVKLLDTATNAVTTTVNGVGQPSSLTQGFVTPIAPAAPTLVSVTGGNGQASVAFTAPAVNGGSAILNYTATCNPGGFNATAATSPILVTGLTNGTPYNCSVAATNAVGTGTSSATGGVTPSTSPVFSSGNSVTFTVNTFGTFTATATGSPTPTLSQSGTLPAGVSFAGSTGSGVLSGTAAPGTVGSYPITLTATNVGGTTNQNFTLTIVKANQTITSFNTLPDTAFGSTPPALVASASSGLPVTFTSSTTSVCTVSGTTISMLATGTCTIVASQPGDSNYNPSPAAPPVSRSFNVFAVAPGAPTIGAATPGNGQASIAFTPPAFGGGAAITSYRATCMPGGFTNTGAASPIVVSGLTNGVSYSCSVTATNSAGTGAASGSVNVTPFITGISINPATLDFGGQSMGTSFSLPVTVTNTGTTSVNVASVSISGAAFTQTNNCATLVQNASCTINVTFAAAIAAGALNSGVPASGSITIATNAPGSPHGVTLAGSAEKSLVSHYYRSILRRAADSGGKAFWSSEAARMQSIGANVNEAWFAMAQFFYFSAEYAAFSRNPTEFTTDLYNTFFNRPPDSGGLAFWVGLINQGMPREVILASFMFSAEFNQFAQNIFGNTAARAEVDVVMDFYRGLLARLPDQGGFDSWVAQFRQAQCAGAAAVSAKVDSISTAFTSSGEYTGKNRTNAQYVGDLYNAFLRRGGDLQGVQFWINQLDSQTLTRNQVRQSFIASNEFQGRVTNVVNQGCLP